LSQRIVRVMPELNQSVRAQGACRRCPFCGPMGECLDPALKSGRCGDWIWWVRDGRQRRRSYVRPHDPRSAAQLRSRARLSAASRDYSCSLSEEQRTDAIAAGANCRTRPRLAQSGPMTGQQYWITLETGGRPSGLPQATLSIPRGYLVANR
jgi:hypothetical protein